MSLAETPRRVVIVTGASRGIGRALSSALLAQGYQVVITGSRDHDALTRVEDAASENGLVMRADVRDASACARVVEATLSKFGRIDALINNAGRGMIEISDTFHREPTRFWETSGDAWRSIFDVNVHGVFEMTKAVVPHMITNRDGVILNVSTSAATMMRRGYSPYGPSKVALEAMTAIWADELEEFGVRVNVVLPGGATDTSFVPGNGPNRSGADGMLLPPEIMIAPVSFLLSEDARGLSGRRFIARTFDAKAALDAPRIRDGIGAR